MDKDAIKTVDQWIHEIAHELWKLNKCGEVLTHREVLVFVNHGFVASITLGHVKPDGFAWLRTCGLTDTEEEFDARLDAYDERFGGGHAYSISDGIVSFEFSEEDDYEESLANKPARIEHELEWRPYFDSHYNSFSDHEYIGEIWLKLVEED